MKYFPVVFFLCFIIASCENSSDKSNASSGRTGSQDTVAPSKAERFDSVTITADSLHKKYVEKLRDMIEFRQVAKEYADKNNLPFTDIINSTDGVLANIEVGVAQNAINVVDANDNVRKALGDVRAFTYNKDNETLANLAALFNNSKIDGFRIYVAKIDSQYKLIVVGTKDVAVAGSAQKTSVDQIAQYPITLPDGTTKTISTLQDYSDPCRPCNTGQGSRF